VQSIDGRPVYAATDLVAYLACEHLTELERAAMAGLVKRPMRDDPELDVIRKRGFEHEQRYRDDLAAEGRQVTSIELDGSIEDDGERLRTAAAETIEAMASGADVVYQATFFDGTTTHHGHPSGVHGITRSPIPSSRVTSRAARSCRSARMSTSSSASRASARNGCTSRSVAVRGRWSGSASTTTWPTTEGSAIGSWPWSPHRIRSSRPPTPIPTRSITATSAAGRPNAWSGAGLTTT
jgi:hypothetical protein